MRTRIECRRMIMRRAPVSAPRRPAAHRRLASLFLASLCLAALLTPGLAHAHEVLHTVAQSDAVVITLSYADGSPFAFEGYEVYFEDESIPTQVGRTDKLGRIAFLPDRTGRWRIKAFSEDGHGAEFAIEAGAQGGAARAGGSAFERYGRLLIGIAIILGLFGLLQLFCRRRTP